MFDREVENKSENKVEAVSEIPDALSASMLQFFCLIKTDPAVIIESEMILKADFAQFHICYYHNYL